MRKKSRIEIRLHEDEKAEIEKLAKRSELSVSEYLLRRGLGQEVHPGVIPATKEVIVQLKRIGNNANQITHYLNLDNLMGSPRLKRQTKKEVRELNKTIDTYLKEFKSYLGN